MEMELTPHPSDMSVRFHCQKQFSTAFLEMNSMRDSKVLCDVVLVADGDEIPAHRVVLASLSPYFRAMFTGDMAESKQKVITINGIDVSSLKALIDYAYTASLDISEENVQSILPAASVLQFEEVKQACSEFLRRQLDTDNCLGIKVFAEVHGCGELKVAATVFSGHYFSDVWKTDEFLKLSQEEIASFLSNEQLNVSNEFEVYKAAVLWLLHDESSRAQHVYDTLRLVRLPLLTAEQLLHTVGKEPIVVSNPKCVELLMEALQCHLLPATRSKVWYVFP